MKSAPSIERFHPDHTIPAGDDWIWVFGSNLKGRHGKGAAKVARESFGASYGVAFGPTGRAYAIPTKSVPTMEPQHVLPLEDIAVHVGRFIEYARANPDKRFFVTAVGTGLSRLQDAQIAPLFAGAPENCSFAQQWRPFIEQPTSDLAVVSPPPRAERQTA